MVAEEIEAFLDPGIEGHHFRFGSRIPFITDADLGPLLGKAEVRAEKDRSWGYNGPFWRDPHTSVFSQYESSSPAVPDSCIWTVSRVRCAREGRDV